MNRLHRAAAARHVRVPTAATLRRYGLSADEWLALLAAQGWKCPPCDRPAGGALILNTDHEHVPNWKRLPPHERKRFVRGVLCAHCNHRLVDSRIPAAKARRIADYLTAYETRRDAQ